MKFSAVLIAAIAAQTSAFAPAPFSRSCSSLSAAKSAAEDIDLTVKAIMDSPYLIIDGNLIEDTGEGITDEIPPAEPIPYPSRREKRGAATAADPAPAATKSSTGIELWSVGYDDAAMLAYKAAGSSGDFEAFKTKYIADTSAMCGKKNPYTK
ncbi:MAG: hypothetical protein ACO3P3_07065 [Candidatus Nanopelagicales bacterium]